MKRRIITGSAVMLFFSASGLSISACGSPRPSPTPSASTEASGPERQSFQTRYRAARTFYLEGVAGDADAAARARTIFEELNRREPDNALVTAYLGSSRVLEAKETILPWKKGELVKAGLKLLDRAVEMAPENLEVRFIRGISSYPLPFFFGVGDEAAEDFAFVAAKLVDDPTAARPEIAAAAFYYHGVCLEDDDREEEAVGFWKKSAAAAPDSTYAEQAREELEDRGEE